MIIEGACRMNDSANGWPGLCRITIEKRAKLGLVADIHRCSVYRNSGAFEFTDRCDALANRSLRFNFAPLLSRRQRSPVQNHKTPSPARSHGPGDMEAGIAKSARYEIGSIGPPRERCCSDFRARRREQDVIRNAGLIEKRLGLHHLGASIWRTTSEASVECEPLGSRSTRPPQKSGCSSAITRAVPQSAA